MLHLELCCTDPTGAIVVSQTGRKPVAWLLGYEAAEKRSSRYLPISGPVQAEVVPRAPSALQAKGLQTSAKLEVGKISRRDSSRGPSSDDEDRIIARG